MITEEGIVSDNLSPSDIVINHPFFQSAAATGNKIEQDNIYEISENDKIILHPEILKLYEKIGYDKEYLFKNFTFMTLREILNRKDNYAHIYDIAVKYLGLGHILLISYHSDSQKFIFRRDGGSNGWDREHNYNLYKNYNIDKTQTCSEDNPRNYSFNILYTFEQVMSILTNNNNEDL